MPRNLTTTPYHNAKATSDDPEDAMTEPEEQAAAIAGHLRAALEKIEAYSTELAGETAEEAV